MKQIKPLTLALLLAAIFFAGCKKDDKEKSNKEHLTTGTWLIKGLTSDPPFFGVTDLYADVEDCDKDNVFTYNTNGVMIFDEGGTKCDAAEPQSISGSWILGDNETTLTTYLDGDTALYKIMSINNNNMVLQLDQGFVFTFTFGR